MNSKLTKYTPTTRTVVRGLLSRWVPLTICSLAIGLLIAIALLRLDSSSSLVSADSFQFTESPVPMSNVSSTNWYGNTEYAYQHRTDLYAQTQGFHSGVDFLVPASTPIRTTVNRTGTVISINNAQYNYATGPGNVAVDYGDYIVLYGHTMTTPPQGTYVKQVGQQVNPGDVVAYSGSDGSWRGLTVLSTQITYQLWFPFLEESRFVRAGP